jgi:hypothetical protein
LLDFCIPAESMHIPANKGLDKFSVEKNKKKHFFQIINDRLNLNIYHILDHLMAHLLESCKMKMRSIFNNKKEHSMFKPLTYLLLIIFIVGLATAQVPAAPANLTVEKFIMDKDQVCAKLQWQYPMVNNAQFRVYKALDSLPFVRLPHEGWQNNHIDCMVPPGHLFRYYVTAFVNNIESLPSNEVFFVNDSTPPPPPLFVHGFIKGTILDDSTGLPVGDVRLRFFKENGWMYWREARTDSLGNYFAPIDTGSYLVYATKWTYIPEWFDNSLIREGAIPVPITEGDTTQANFGLKRIPLPPPPVWVNVTGTVTDSASDGTQTPLQNAIVVFMRTNHQINVMQNFDGTMCGNRDETFFIPEFGTVLGAVGKARTDSNGNYTVRVPAGLTYIAVAVKPGYIPEFYDNKRTPFDADKINITGETSGINFDLVPNPITQNTLSGKVKNELNEGVVSRVVIFQRDNKHTFPIRCTVTDSLGNYSFNHLLSGYYFAKAVPFAFYAPAWYNIDSCGVFCWANADSFMVVDNTTGIDICVRPVITSGFASIMGNVSEMGKIGAVQGVTVYAVSLPSNDIAGYDITEQDGNFELTNLSPGNYKIVVDKEGYNSLNTPVYSVGVENNFTESNAQITVQNIALGVDGKDNSIPNKYSIDQNFPNPFNPTTGITFSLPKISKVTVAVYNILGQQVATLINSELGVGDHKVVWNGVDASGMSVGSGVYFYKISANSLDNTSKFSSVKKMLLIK